MAIRFAAADLAADHAAADSADSADHATARNNHAA